MKVGSIVITPRNLVAKIISIRHGRADLRYLDDSYAGGFRYGRDFDVSLPLRLLKHRH